MKSPNPMPTHPPYTEKVKWICKECLWGNWNLEDEFCHNRKCQAPNYLFAAGNANTAKDAKDNNLEREAQKKLARLKTVMGPVGGTKGQQILEGAGVAAMTIPTCTTSPTTENTEPMDLDGIPVVEDAAESDPKKKREEALALQKKIQTQLDAAIAGNFDKDVITMLREKLGKIDVPAENLNFTDNAMMLSEALTLRATTQKLHKKQEEEGANRLRKAEEALSKAQLHLEQETSRQQDEMVIRAEVMSKLNMACDTYQRKMDAEKTQNLAPSSNTLSPTVQSNIQVPKVNLENIPKLDPVALQDVLTNAPPDVARYLSMCSEMLQVAMAATVQQRGGAPDGSGSGPPSVPAGSSEVAPGHAGPALNERAKEVAINQKVTMASEPTSPQTLLQPRPPRQRMCT